VAGLLIRSRLDRERSEATELSPAACLVVNSRGRPNPEPPDHYRTAFEVDRDRILHSKAFRRLKHKTQVLINPEDDHVVTRLTHTLNVTQIGRAIARALALNPDLTEAICLGHDVGHSPFGHIGEEALSAYADGEWLHARQSVRIFETVEPINPSWEVSDGIRAHSWKINPPPSTQEGLVCRYADRIAYLTHDSLDAIRAGVIVPSDLPARAVAVLGQPGASWVGLLLEAVIEYSAQQGSVEMNPAMLEVIDELRTFMFARVYERPQLAAQRRGVVTVIRNLVEYFLAHPEALPVTFQAETDPLLTRVIDYVAGMTDRYALRVHTERIGTPPLVDAAVA